MSQPVRIQRKRTKGWRMPANTIYVGRGSGWGNPFKVGEPHPKTGLPMTHKDAVMLYIEDMTPYTHHGPHNGLDAFLTSSAVIEGIIDQLEGKNLACWCSHDVPCHADWLLKIANDSGLKQTFDAYNDSLKPSKSN